MNDDNITFNTHIRSILSDKCFTCHGPDGNQRKANLRLDTEKGALALLDSGNGSAIVPGSIEKSLLYQRIMSTDPQEIMPPPESNLVMTPEEKEIIKKWITSGAQYEKHWAFIPPKQVKVPDFGNWGNNEIDGFVLARMKQEGLSPEEAENPYLLLRRMYHDLTGLPPSIADQEKFINNEAIGVAYENAVDDALSSTAYGEKMAILWMDIARYADSHGYQDDGLRTMWPWRDWVIHAFNQNYSYKKFITWQLAGDLLPNANKESILATGFNRNHKITQEGGVIDEEYRIEYVTDRTNTFGKAMLGMTFECAKCHDHKYDPISQEEYYGTFAFFNQVAEKGFYGDISIESLADPPRITISDEDINQILNFINKQDTTDVQVMVMQDDSISRTTYLLKRGVYDNPGKVVEYATPKDILPFDSLKYNKDRFGLAGWVFDEENPLTARVFVNIIWEEIFGKGLVATTGDFGMQGSYPSHPDLLDWLAVDFRENGWDIKRLIKQMVMSSTYRQSQRVDPDKYRKDPENRFLSRAPRNRLKAELLRDHILTTAGLINREIGGPSVKPYQPSGLWEAATSGRGLLRNYQQDHGNKLYRRGLYTFIKRTVPPPAMLTFDASNRDQCEVTRQSTQSPLQALILLNDPQVLEAARYFAQNLVDTEGSSKNKLETAFQTIICRPPQPKETKIIHSYFNKILEDIDENTAMDLLTVGEIEKQFKNPIETAAYMQCIQMIYNLEEAIMR